jgi:general stress protein 26
MSRADSIKALQEQIKDIDIAMLTTVESDGTLRSRPMGTQQVEFDGDLWFFTYDDAPKVDEIARERQVNVAYSRPDKQSYVSVSGRAKLVRDRKKIDELWNPFYKIWFQNGKDDPRIALLKVEVTQAEYWDFSSNKIVQLVDFAKALLTHSELNADNEKLDLA